MQRTQAGLWTLSARRENTKNKMELAGFALPHLVSGWVDKYLTTYRPVLVGTGDDTRYLFVTYGGKGPRSAIQAVVQNIVKQLLGVRVSPHRFRSIIATVLAEEGKATSIADLNAISRSMLTSTSTLLKSYIRINPQLDYSRAQGHLDSVLGKRVRVEEAINVE